MADRESNIDPVAWGGFEGGMIEGATGLPGTELLDALMAGEVRMPPVGEAIGLRLIGRNPEKGQVALEFESAPWMLGPDGRLHSAVLVGVIDLAALLAVRAFLPGDDRIWIQESHVTHLQTPPSTQCRFECLGDLEFASSSAGIASTVIRPGGGQQIARGLTRFKVEHVLEPLVSG